MPPVPVVLSPLPSTASASNQGPHEPSGFWARTLATASGWWPFQVTPIIENGVSEVTSLTGD